MKEAVRNAVVNVFQGSVKAASMHLQICCRKTKKLSSCGHGH